MFYFKNIIIVAFIANALIFMLIFKFNYKHFIVLASLIIVIIVLSCLLKHEYNLKYLWNILDKTIHFNYLRSNLSDYLDQHYNKDTSVYLKLLLLNIKTYKHEIINKLNNLNIIHLFVVSGIHISILNSLISKLLRKLRITNFIVNITTMLFLCYLSGFSISIIRVIINFIIKTFWKHKNSFNTNLVTSIVINCLFINEVHNYGYLLSIICSLYITFLTNIIKSKIVLYLIINIFTSIIVLAIVNEFNIKINILYFINNMILSNIVLISYFVSLITCWIPFMFNIFENIVYYQNLLFDQLLMQEVIFSFKLAEWVKYVWYLVIIDTTFIYFVFSKKYQDCVYTKLLNKLKTISIFA